jgi:hypothetical protein
VCTNTLLPWLALLAVACGHKAQTEPAPARAPIALSGSGTVSAAPLPIGPVGPAAAGLGERKLSRDLRAYHPGKDVEREWLLADLDVIERTRRALPPAARRGDLITALPSSVKGEHVDLGFDRVRDEQIFGGGYLSCRFTMVGFHDDLELVDVNCYWPESAPAAVHAALRDALGPAFELTTRGIGYRTGYVRFDFPRKTAEARNALSRELGALTPVEVPAELREPYELLLSPLHTLDIGEDCYEGGEPPEGRVAARKLVIARRVDLLRNVLRGPNPEARLYAARGLRELGALSDADRALTLKLRKLKLPLVNCSGCMVHRETSEETWKEWENQRL